MWRMVLAALLLATASGAGAQEGSRISRSAIVDLAGQGRYDELADRLAPATARMPAGELHALCHAYAQTRRYRPLMACLDRLETALRGRDRASILFGLDDATATVPLMRAAALLDLGDAPAAAEQAARARSWFEREGSAGERDLLVEALTLQALATARQQDSAQAQELLRQIEAIKPSLGAAPNLANARTLGLARGYLAIGQYDKACAALDQDRSFDFRRSVDAWLNGNPPNWVWQQLPRLFMLARCRQGQGRAAEAKAGYDELLALPVLRQNRGIAWLVMHGRARIAEDEGDRATAERLLRDALDLIEQLRSGIDTEAAKIGFVADKQAVYGALITLLLAQNQAAEALVVVERAKARALVDLLADRYSTAAAEQVLPRGDARLASLLQRHREAEEALQTQNPTRSEAAWSQQRNSVLQASAQLRQAAPELASLVSATPATAAELVALLDKDEVGLQYHVQGEQLVALVFGPGVGTASGPTGSRAFTLDGVGLLNDVRDFRTAITRRSPQALALGQKLHRRLVAPLQEALGNRAVLLVPHGVLHYLPFAALHDGQRYLLDRHPLRLSTSVSALKYLRPTPAPAAAPVLILGNPTGDLPSAEQEARRLKRLLPGATLLLGSAATRAALFAQAPPARTVHIASHAVFDPRQPLDSRLLLAPAGAPESGELRVSDVYGLRLTADLVTLSACETGLGRITDGGEVIGMTRGFLYAGATSVVSSLWQVPDEATAALMESFYGKLPRLIKRDALRAAQLELMRRGEPPFAWASFYLSGSAR